MSLQVIPLTSSLRQAFTAALTVDGKPLSLNLKIRYNAMGGMWMLTIADVNNNLLIDSVPMITGAYPAGNLLQQQRYLNIGSWFLVNVSNTQTQSGGSASAYGQGGYGTGPYGGVVGGSGTDYPNQYNLGSDFQLWVDDTPLS